MPVPTELAAALAETYQMALTRMAGACEWRSLTAYGGNQMPPLYRRVLVTLEDESGERRVDVAYWDGRLWHLARSPAVNAQPLGWMALPDPLQS
jgi:hypothetical protein